MRVLHVIQGLETGGAERIVVTLAAEAIRAGHEVAVASPPGSLQAELDGVRFEMPFIRRDVRKLPSAVATLASIVRRWSPDVLHCHQPTMGLVAALATGRGAWRPALVSVHGVQEEDYEQSGRILRLTGFMTVACGPGVETALRDQGVRRITTIVNGVSPAPPPATRQELADRFGIPLDVPLVVAVGRLAPQKDHATAIRALAALPWASFMLVGDGPLREPLDRLISSSESASRSTDGCPAGGETHHRAADAVVISSRWEGLPLVALETLASGVPLVATDVRGNRELLRDGHDAVLAPPGDPIALARAIEGCLLDDALRSELVAGGLRAAALYTEERMSSRFFALYRELVVGARGQRPPGHPVADREESPRSEARRDDGRRPQPIDEIPG